MALAAEAGVDDFVAEAKPEEKLRLIRREQAQCRLVAMTGDGTNDAPALAQADVGLAIHSGTVAAKEAASLIDLDSEPTKLIDLVSIGKQMLITRGAHDLLHRQRRGEILCDHPGDVHGRLAGTRRIEPDGTGDTAQCGIVCFDFQRTDYSAVIPLALRGVRFLPTSAETTFYRNLMVYGVGGLIAPFIGIKLIDMSLSLVL